jgi:hypothetical protein
MVKQFEILEIHVENESILFCRDSGLQSQVSHSP